MNPLRPLLLLLALICILCAHSTMARPGPHGSMTRIQEVFRTLMGAKPMMLASRGKKSLFALPNAREFLDAQQQLQESEEGEEGPASGSSSYWIVADERLPVVAVRMSGEEGERRRR